MVENFFKKIVKRTGITHVATLNDEFIGMQLFKDKLFVATKNGVYFVNKHNKLEPVKFVEGSNENR
jgi:hypothetical protein